MSTWVLLRGLARDSRHWEGFPALLQQASADGAQVVALDLPGNGKLWDECSPTSVPHMVALYRQQLASSRIAGPVNLLGLSLGAMVAIEWAAQHPQDLASAVLVNGSVGGISPACQRLQLPAAWQLLVAASARAPASRERRILAACTNLADLDIAARRWTVHAGEARTRPANLLRQLAAAMRYRLPVQRPAVPMLVLAGAQDRLVSVECSIEIARRWSLPLVLHPRAGHEIAMDDPAWLVRQCTRWVGGMHTPR